MPIVSSSYAIDAHAQRDGSHWVKETHTSSDGRVFAPIYLLGSGQGDAEAIARMNARVNEIDAILAAIESESLLGS